MKPCWIGSEDVCVGHRVLSWWREKRLSGGVWGREREKCLGLGALQRHLSSLCLMAWFCPACVGSWKWLTSAQLWKWATAPAAGGCDTALTVPSRQFLNFGPLPALWTSVMFTMACRVAWLCLRVTAKGSRSPAYFHALKAQWLQRGGVIFLLPRSVLMRGNSLLSLSFFFLCVYVHEAYAAGMLKASISVFRIYDHIV